MLRSCDASNRKFRPAGTIVFSYDYGHMFCVLDDVFAKSVTGITGQRLNKLLWMPGGLEA